MSEDLEGSVGYLLECMSMCVISSSSGHEFLTEQLSAAGFEGLLPESVYWKDDVDSYACVADYVSTISDYYFLKIRAEAIDGKFTVFISMHETKDGLWLHSQYRDVTNQGLDQVALTFSGDTLLKEVWEKSRSKAFEFYAGFLKRAGLNRIQADKVAEFHCFQFSKAIVI